MTSSTNPLAPNAPAAPGGTGPTGGNAFRALSQNYETFLKLLTTQLQNQDPLQPQDSSEFTKQLVTFSQVEQQIATNEKLDRLAVNFQQGQAIQAMGYIGKVVEFSGDVVPLQNKRAEMGITLQGQTREATVEIYDTKGKLVATRKLSNTLSTQLVTWDGKDDGGRQLEDGIYQVKVKAKAANGDSVKSDIRASGRVTAVDMATGATNLLIGNMPIGLENILSVRNT